MRCFPAHDECMLGVRHSNSRMHEAAVEIGDLHVPQTGVVGLSSLRVQRSLNFTRYCMYATVWSEHATVGHVQVIAWQGPCGDT